MWNAGNAAVGKAKEVNDKHNITGKVSGALATGYEKAKEVEEKHHVGKKVGAALTSSLDTFTDLIEMI